MRKFSVRWWQRETGPLAPYAMVREIMRHEKSAVLALYFADLVERFRSECGQISGIAEQRRFAAIYYAAQTVHWDLYGEWCPSAVFTHVQPPRY